MKKRTKNPYQQRFEGIKGPKPHTPYRITKQMVKEIKRDDLPANEQSLHKCINFIFQCYSQAQEDLYSDGSFYLEELMMVLSGLYADLIQEGNFRLAGSLPTVLKRLTTLEQLNKAYSKYGTQVRIKPSPRYWYNRFVENLYRGYLWDGGGPQRSCPWLGRNDLPPVDNISAWMKLVEPFLKKKYTKPSEIIIFRAMLKSHKAVYAQNPNRDKLLSNDKLCYQWNQVFKKIRNAWVEMAKRYKAAPTGN